MSSDARTSEAVPVSRRGLVRAGAWGAPTLVALAAAPAFAASPPKIGTVTGTKKVVEGVQQVTLSIPVTGATAGSSITITSISGGGVGANTWQLPVTAAISGGSATALVLRNNNASGTFTATYVINPGGYTGTFTFTL